MEGQAGGVWAVLWPQKCGLSFTTKDDALDYAKRSEDYLEIVFIPFGGDTCRVKADAGGVA